MRSYDDELLITTSLHHKFIILIALDFTLCIVLVTTANTLMCLFSLSASVSDGITNIIAMVALSTVINRVVEISAISKTAGGQIVQHSMPAGAIVLAIAGVILETISIGFRSLSLGFRFLANVSAGHVLCDLAHCIKYSLYFFSDSVVTVCLLIYESGVSCIQIGVYLALAQVYAEV